MLSAYPTLLFWTPWEANNGTGSILPFLPLLRGLLPAQPTTPSLAPHTSPQPPALMTPSIRYFSWNFLIKPWKEKSGAMPGSPSPLLKFREICRGATEAFPQGDACAPEISVSSTLLQGGKAGPQQERKSLRVTPGKRSEVALEVRPRSPLPLSGHLILPRAVFILD